MFVTTVLLDTRWFRSPLSRARTPQSFDPYIASTDTGATVLGETQWKWLGEQLQQRAEVRRMVSSIQLVVDGHGFERWSNFPLERQRFFELLERTDDALERALYWQGLPDKARVQRVVPL